MLVVDCPTRPDGAFPGFSRDGGSDAVAVAFNPDGDVIYIATSGDVSALDSDGNSASANWNQVVADNDLSDITVSPDGLSV